MTDRPLRLLYITYARIPSERAAGIQIMKMCEAFARAGLAVRLVVPRAVRRRVEPKEFDDLWSYYSITHPFKITRLPVLDLRFFHIPESIRLIIFTLQSISFALIGSAYAVLKRGDFIFTRSYLLILTLILFSPLHQKRLLYAVHSLPSGWRRLYAMGLRMVDGIIVLNKRAREDLCSLGIHGGKILVAPDGFDPKLFADMKDKVDARRKEHIPEGAKIILYTGHLYEWKGVHTLVRSMRYLNGDCLLYLVGGYPNHVDDMRRFVEEEGLSHKVILRGHVPPERVRNFLAAADVAVLPNSAKSINSRYYTSPLKLFEYMAAGKPIVASRLPSLEEILSDGENALLVEPDDPEKLAEGIRKIFADDELAETLAGNAGLQAADYTWDRRAEKILKFMESLMADGKELNPIPQ